MRILLVILLSIPTVAAAQIGPPPTNDIHWIRTSTDTLSLDPPRFQIGFKIVNDTPDHGVCEFTLRHYPGGSSTEASCSLLECQAPAGWSCYLDPNGNAYPNWSAHSGDNDNCVEPMETVEGFAFITAGESCCYLAQAWGPVFNVVAQNTLCIGDAQAVQILQSTWGRVKTIYR